MKILFVASEVVPFAKTGGLADVAGALPKALAQLGHDVRVVMPRYRAIDPLKFTLKKSLDRVALDIPNPGLPSVVGAGAVEVSVFEAVIPQTRVITYFIDAPAWFDRDGLYQDKGKDFPDNLVRFSGFAQAVLAALPQFGWAPEVVHCHDWQTALLLPQLALTRADDRFWGPASTVLTVHNLAYQGLFPSPDWPLTKLPDQAFGIEGLEFYGRINCLKGGLVFADMLTTVSPTYAKEIQSAEFGCGLEGVLISRQDRLSGILNGIDPGEWDPRQDPFIAAKYTPEELAGKSLCKLALQRHQKLPERHDLLIGMIQRLAEQKGIDIFTQAAPELLKLPVQVVILGTGDQVYHEKLTALAAQFPEQIALNLKFDNALAHQIEAGSDAFLMPSRFEPCGLNQMYSMRYGAVPVVRRVGGLADTVMDVSPSSRQAQRATGFVFEPYTPGALLEAVTRAVAGYQDHALWEQLMRTGMRQDFSWDRSAREYASVYERAHDYKRHAQSLAR